MPVETTLEHISMLLADAGAAEYSLRRKSPWWSRFILRHNILLPMEDPHQSRGKVWEGRSKKEISGGHSRPLSIPLCCWVGEGRRVVSESETEPKRSHELRRILIFCLIKLMSWTGICRTGILFSCQGRAFVWCSHRWTTYMYNLQASELLPFLTQNQ